MDPFDGRTVGTVFELSGFSEEPGGQDSRGRAGPGCLGRPGCGQSIEFPGARKSSITPPFREKRWLRFEATRHGAGAICPVAGAISPVLVGRSGARNRDRSWRMVAVRLKG